MTKQEHEADKTLGKNDNTHGVEPLLIPQPQHEIPGKENSLTDQKETKQGSPETNQPSSPASITGSKL